MATFAKELNALAEKAKAACSIKDMTYGNQTGEIAGHTVTASVVPVNTNGRQIKQLTWYVDGKKTGKAKVFALGVA